MTEALHIKNFGPIKDIRLDDIRPFTVLIGKSGSGKSVLMKVLVLFRWLFKRYNLHEYLRHREKEGYSLPDTLEEVLPNTELHPFINPANGLKSEISYTVSFKASGKDHQLKFHWRTGQTLTVEGSVPPEALMYLKLSYIPETRGFIPSALYKPQMPRGADFGFFFHEVLNEFGESNEFVKRMELPFLNVDYRVENKGIVTEHHITGRTSDYDIELKHASSGMQNLIPLLSIVEMYAAHFNPEEAFKKTLPKSISEFVTEGNKRAHLINLHIEEPELGLFPDAQRALMNTLARQCFVENKNQLGVIMATHSPYILAHLNNMLQAGQVPTYKVEAGLPPPLATGTMAAYQIADGTCVSLLDKETGLIGENAIDACSDEIYLQFDSLLDMETHE